MYLVVNDKLLKVDDMSANETSMGERIRRCEAAASRPEPLRRGAF